MEISKLDLPPTSSYAQILDSSRDGDCALSSRNVLSDPRNLKFYEQFLYEPESENRDNAFMVLAEMTDFQRATLFFTPGAYSEFTTALTNSIFNVFESGTAKEKGATFVKLIESFCRIHTDLKYGLFATGNNTEQKIVILDQIVDVMKTLNQNQAFTNLDLSKLILSDLNLSALSHYELVLNLSDTLFINANLEFADLSNTILLSANFKNANMRYITLTNSTMSFSILTKADMSHAELINTKLMNTVMKSTLLFKADLTNANTTNANLDGADLAKAIFIETMMPDGKIYFPRQRAPKANEIKSKKKEEL